MLWDKGSDSCYIICGRVVDLSVCGLGWYLSGPGVSHTFCLPQHEPIPEVPRLLSNSLRSPATRGLVAGWLPPAGWHAMPGMCCAHILLNHDTFPVV